MRSRAAAATALAVATACTGDPGTDLAAGLAGSLIAILFIASCGFTVVSGALVGGAISLRLNLRQPSARSRLAGIALGVLNVAHGALGSLSLYTMLTLPPSEDPPEPDVLVCVALGSCAALALGVACIVAAVRAKLPPQE